MQSGKQSSPLQPTKSVTPLEVLRNFYLPPDFRLLIALLLIILLLHLTSCAFLVGAPEPRIDHTIYLPLRTTTGTKLQGSGDSIDVDEPRFLDLYCSPIDDLAKIKAKYNACKVWQ